jgi:hypothetical protein
MPEGCMIPLPVKRTIVAKIQAFRAPEMPYHQRHEPAVYLHFDLQLGWIVPAFLQLVV